MQSFCTLVVMDSQTNIYPDDNVITSPNSTTLTNTTGTSSPGVQYECNEKYVGNGIDINPNFHMMVSDSTPNFHMNNNNNTNDYAEITTGFGRTMKETALQQIQREIDEQLNRLKNLNNKEFLAEMEVIKNNLNLSDNQMVDILLMTLREVPIRYRNCPCGLYIHIKQKYNNCLFTSNNTSSNVLSYNNNNNNYESTYNSNPSNSTPYNDNDNEIMNEYSQTPPTPETSTKIKKYPNVNSFKSLFNNQDTPQTIDKQPTDIDSILESEEMEYKLEISKNIDNTNVSTSNYNQYQTQPTTMNNTKLYIDTVAITENEHIINNVCLKIFYKLREFILFFIPFIHTFILSLISLIISLEIITDTYNKNNNQCNICNNIHTMFFGSKLNHIINNGTQFELKCFYILLLFRMSTILCWYILLIHTLLFNPITCCCCCCCNCEIEI
eukprot:189579_1